MKLHTNLFIAEEKFARRFAKELMHKIKNEITLGNNSFKMQVISEQPHWTGGRGYDNDRELQVAEKITYQLIRYYDLPYEVKTENPCLNGGFEFSTDGKFSPDYFDNM